MAAGQPTPVARRVVPATAALLAALLAAGCSSEKTPPPATGPISIVITAKGRVTVDGQAAAEDLADVLGQAILQRLGNVYRDENIPAFFTVPTVLSVETPSSTRYELLARVLRACGEAHLDRVCVEDAQVSLAPVSTPFWTSPTGITFSPDPDPNPTFTRPIDLQSEQDLDLLRLRSSELRGQRVRIGAAPDAPADLVITVMRTVYLAGTEIYAEDPFGAGDVPAGVLISIEPDRGDRHPEVRTILASIRRGNPVTKVAESGPTPSFTFRHLRWDGTWTSDPPAALPRNWPPSDILLVEPLPLLTTTTGVRPFDATPAHSP
jgi:hypothetical protein